MWFKAGENSVNYHQTYRKCRSTQSHVALRTFKFYPLMTKLEHIHVSICRVMLLVRKNVRHIMMAATLADSRHCIVWLHTVSSPVTVCEESVGPAHQSQPHPPPLTRHQHTHSLNEDRQLPIRLSAPRL